MTAEAAVRTWLLNDAAVAALVGTRIYDQVLPQLDRTRATSAQYPAVVYARASARPRGLTQDRRSGTDRPRIQIDVYATAPASKEAVYDAVFGALHGRGWVTTDGDVVQLVAHEGDNDTAPEDGASPEPGVRLYRRSADFRVTFQKA